MKNKQFDPARQNTISPAPGLASVNTHNPGEEPQAEEQDGTERVNAVQQDKEAAERTTKDKEGNNDL